MNETAPTTRLQKIRQPRPAAATFTRTQQTLHWFSALLILAMFPMGLVMARTESESLRSNLYAAHAAVGLAVALVAVVRLTLTRRRPVAPPPGMPRWNEVLHRSVHVLALVVPVLLALSGIGTLATNGLLPSALQPGTAVPAVLEDARAQTGHRLMAYAYAALLFTHVAGVMRYQRTKGNVMARMGVKSFLTGPAEHN